MKTTRKFLLTSDEPLAYDVLNANSTIPFVLSAPHAGGRTPKKLGTLGFGQKKFKEVCERYPYGDIGVADLSKELARLTGAFTLLSNYHRRVVDINRPRNNKAFNLRGGCPPANINMTDQEQEERFQAIFDPYHKALRQRIETAEPKFLIDVHSFHKHIAGDKYDIGFLYTNKAGEKMAHEFGSVFDNNNSLQFKIGYNAPYDLANPEINDGVILKTYEQIPGLCLEIRNDHIDTNIKAANFAVLIHNCIKLYTRT